MIANLYGTLPSLKKFFSRKISYEIRKEKNKEKIHLESKIIDWLTFRGLPYQEESRWNEIFAQEASFNIINRILLFAIFKRSILSEEEFYDLFSKLTYESFLEQLNEALEETNYALIFQKNILDILGVDEKIFQDLVQKPSNITQKDNDILKTIYEEHVSTTEKNLLGQYFTPNYIIRLIINSIDNLKEINLTPSTPDFKILDPSCGSGGFLIEFYTFLKDKVYPTNLESHVIHRMILEKNLHGFDIELLALQFTILNLLIKDSAYTVQKLNLSLHNTLIDGKDTPKGKNHSDYDVVVGNPPYFLLSKQKQVRLNTKKFHTTYFPEDQINYYRSKYKSWPHNNRNPNMFYLFVERGIELLRDQGCLGYIIPDIILAGDSSRNLRKFILNTCTIKKIYLIDGKIFEREGISNIILILQKCNNNHLRKNNEVEVINTSIYELVENDISGNYEHHIESRRLIPQDIFVKNPFNVFSVRITKKSVPIFQNIYQKISENQLMKLGTIVNIQRGIENLSKKDTLSSPPSEKLAIRKVIAADNINKYKIVWAAPAFKQRFIDYDPEKKTKIDFKKESWYTQPKIVLKRVSSRLVGALDNKKEDKTQYFFTLDSIQMIWLKDQYKEKYRLRVLLCILNSDFMNFYYKNLFSYKKLFSRVQKVFLEELPIPETIESSIQSRICDLARKLETEYNTDIDKELNGIINSLFFTKEELLEYGQLLTPTYSLKDIKGLGVEARFKLSKCGIYSINDLLNCNTSEIAEEIKGISIRSLDNWKCKARSLS